VATSQGVLFCVIGTGGTGEWLKEIWRPISGGKRQKPGGQGLTTTPVSDGWKQAVKPRRTGQKRYHNWSRGKEKKGDRERGANDLSKFLGRARKLRMQPLYWGGVRGGGNGRRSTGDNQGGEGNLGNLSEGVCLKEQVSIPEKISKVNCEADTGGTYPKSP